jgi:hypothetical protein
MYRYYSNAVVCYAYLCDVHNTTRPAQPPTKESENIQFSHSTWFTRGWTLQELLASKHLVFFTSTWSIIGLKTELRGVISAITGISESFLDGYPLRYASIATRMSWVANRVTTRLEDIAYCMLGIFDVNM